MAGSDAILRLDGVSKSFGGVHAVRDVSIALQPGERVSMIGANGAGKSTLFNLIAGVFPVTKGRIQLFGADMTRASVSERARRGLARTFQTSQLFDNLTAAVNVFVALGGTRFPGASLRGARGRADQWGEVERLLERVGLSAEATSLAGDLSHGEQRQLELAMALASDPKLLILDEPAAGFSPAERQLLLTLLSDVPDHITLLLIEHDMDIALAVASRVIVMHDGAKLLEGTPADIRASERVREIYLGGARESAS